LAFAKQHGAGTRLLMIAGAMVVGGAASFILAKTAQPILAVVLVGLIGAGLAAFTQVVWSMLQEMAPEKLRGRIFSIFNTGAMSASMIGMVAFGWATDRLGAPTSLFGMAVIFWLTTVAILLLWKFGDVNAAQSGSKQHDHRAAS
jgi:MFS family permease